MNGGLLNAFMERYLKLPLTVSTTLFPKIAVYLFDSQYLQTKQVLRESGSPGNGQVIDLARRSWRYEYVLVKLSHC